MKRWCVVFALTGLAGVADATTVWRCGVDGRSYSDQPCTSGQAVTVADSRSPAQAAQGREALQRDERLLARLVAERHEREREWAARGSGLTGIKPAAVLSERPAGAEAAKRPSKRPSRQSASGTSRKADRASRRGRG